MFCSNCGKNIPSAQANSKFCFNCGAKLTPEKVSEENNNNKPRHSRALKIIIIFLIFFLILIILPFIAYINSFSKPETYTHPTVGFSFTYPKTLNLETPELPKGAKCKTAAPCLVVFKNPSYDNYVVNWLIVVSAADLGIAKEKFIEGAEKGFKEDLKNKVTTVETIGNKTVYKYTDETELSANTIKILAKQFGFNDSQTMRAFITGDATVMIFTQKPPSQASSDYNGYINISSLLIK